MFESPSEEDVKREREKARKLRKTQWWQKKLNSGICHYCGERFFHKKLTMDHIIPLVRGGKSSKGNVVPACKDCNNKKNADIPVETLLRYEK